MLVVIQRSSEEPVLEEVADPFMSRIEPLRVAPIDAVQAFREPLEMRLDDQVIVIPHQTVGVTSPLPPTAEATCETDEECPIGVIEKDRALGNPTRGDVVHAITRQR
jgi:hypothetical protein